MKHKEYYTKSGNRIRLFNGDCMNFMQDLKPNAYNLSIVDPPYGIGYEDGGQYFKQENGNSDKDWDNGIPKAKYFVDLFKKCNNQIIWGANYFLNFLPPSRGIIAWTKTAEIQGRTFSEWEMAWSSFNIRARYLNLKPFQKNGKRIHPTQKPVKLYRWLLQNYADEGDTILDTHGGSFSLAIACWEEDYALDAIELDEDYYKAAVKRFEDHISQKALF